MTELEEQQRNEITRLRAAINTACVDFGNVHEEICQGKSTIHDVEAIIDRLEETISVVAANAMYFDNYGNLRAAPTEF
jgi:predicted  nucleic acid-binding Zn-ribbon protein